MNRQLAISTRVFPGRVSTQWGYALVGMILAWLFCAVGCAPEGDESRPSDTTQAPQDSTFFPSGDSWQEQDEPVECPEFSAEWQRAALPPGCSVLPVPLDESNHAAALFGALVVARTLFEGSANMGLAGGDSRCPDAIVSDREQLFWGGCVSSLGYRFGGELLETFVDTSTPREGEIVRQSLWSARDWSVEGTSQGFHKAAMHGDLSFLQSDKRIGV